MADSVVVASKVKEAVNAEGCNTAGDFSAKLDEKVRMMIKEACVRAKGNGKKTVRALDL